MPCLYVRMAYRVLARQWLCLYTIAFYGVHSVGFRMYGIWCHGFCLNVIVWHLLLGIGYVCIFIISELLWALLCYLIVGLGYFHVVLCVNLVNSCACSLAIAIRSLMVFSLIHYPDLSWFQSCNFVCLWICKFKKNHILRCLTL